MTRGCGAPPTAKRRVRGSFNAEREENVRSGDDDLRIDKLLIELGVLALLV